MKYVCKGCGWIYDEERGYPELDIEPDTPFNRIPKDFECPFCFSGKEKFIRLDD